MIVFVLYAHALDYDQPDYIVSIHLTRASAEVAQLEAIKAEPLFDNPWVSPTPEGRIAKGKESFEIQEHEVLP